MNTAKIFAVICLASATSVASFQILMIFRGNLPFNTLVPFIGVNGAVIGGLFYLGLDAITVNQPEGQVAKKILLVRDKAGRVLQISRAGGDDVSSAFPSKKQPLQLPSVDRKGQVIGLSKTMIGLGLVLEVFLSFLLVSATFTPLLIVQTGSMEPTIMTGEMIWIRGVSPTDVRVGDIITFTIPQNLAAAIGSTEATTITHRVVDIIYNNDNTVSFKTKGDNNPVEDIWTVTSDMLVGRYEMQIPYLGPVVSTIRTPIGIATVIALILLVVGLPEIKKYGGLGDV